MLPMSMGVSWGGEVCVGFSFYDVHEGQCFVGDIEGSGLVDACEVDVVGCVIDWCDAVPYGVVFVVVRIDNKLTVIACYLFLIERDGELKVPVIICISLCFISRDATLCDIDGRVIEIVHLELQVLCNPIDFDGVLCGMLFVMDECMQLACIACEFCIFVADGEISVVFCGRLECCCEGKCSVVICVTCERVVKGFFAFIFKSADGVAVMFFMDVDGICFIIPVAVTMIPCIVISSCECCECD